MKLNFIAVFGVSYGQYHGNHGNSMPGYNNVQPSEGVEQRMPVVDHSEANSNTQNHGQNQYRPVKPILWMDENWPRMNPNIGINTEYIGCVENEGCLAPSDSSVWMCSAKYSTRAMAINSCNLIDSCHYIVEVTNGMYTHFELASKYSKCGFTSTAFTPKLLQKEDIKPATVLEPVPGSAPIQTARNIWTVIGLRIKHSLC